MNYWLIYFVIVLFILVSKFVQALFTIGKLKMFIANNKSVIGQETICEHDDIYNRFFILHLGRFSYGKDYEKTMIADINNYWSSSNLFLIFVFAVGWPIAVPTVLGCLLVGYCSNLFNNILGKILDDNGKYAQLP